ncbi:MAG: hypothetical protein KDB37_06395 [Ilumatobacter sp.]|nr:hypothetical protein [Ilumatobacter sp.]
MRALVAGPVVVLGDRPVGQDGRIVDRHRFVGREVGGGTLVVPHLLAELGRIELFGV